MEIWRDFFKVVYHPGPSIYYVHWQSTSRPTSNNGFYTLYAAEIWLDNNWQTIVNDKFEEIFLDGSK